jgi:hypothetical protein
VTGAPAVIIQAGSLRSRLTDIAMPQMGAYEHCAAFEPMATDSRWSPFSAQVKAGTIDETKAVGFAGYATKRSTRATADRVLQDPGTANRSGGEGSSKQVGAAPRAASVLYPGRDHQGRT